MHDHLWVPFTVPGTASVLEVAGGSGATVVTTSGQRVLDFAAGLWNVGSGYGDQGLADAVSRQLERLAYYPTFRDVRSDVATRLADELARVAGQPDARVVLASGGGSAVDVALKLVSIAREGGTCIALEGSYHGTMYGGSALSGQDVMQGRTRARFDWVRHVAPNDCEGFLDLARQQRLSCVVLEPVLGNGCTPLTDEFVACVVEECERQDALLVADEVATAFGRTGPLFASDAWPRRPDIRIVSKMLTGGVLPLAALLVQPSVWRTFQSQGLALPYGETQAGNPLACAAALEVVARWSRPEHVAATAARARVFERWVEDRVWPLDSVQGRGFMQCITLSSSGVLPGATVEQRSLIVANTLQQSGLRAYVGGDAMCLFPPLTVDDDELERAGQILDETWKLLA